MQKVYAVRQNGNAVFGGNGNSTAKLTTSGSGATHTQLATGAGFLSQSLITAAGSGTGNCIFYDGTTNSGTPIGYLAAGAGSSLGLITLHRMPFSVGLYVENPTNGPAATVSIEQ